MNIPNKKYVHPINKNKTSEESGVIASEFLAGHKLKNYWNIGKEAQTYLSISLMPDQGYKLFSVTNETLQKHFASLFWHMKF